MTAIELRIGNIIHHPHIGGSGYTYVNHRIINDLASHNNALGYKPILLTEEWLGKLGFEKSRILNDDRMYFQIQDKFIAIDSKGYCFYGCADTKYTQLPIIIKHCHVLQNFMYSFAGVELTIKEGAQHE